MKKNGRFNWLSRTTPLLVMLFLAMLPSKKANAFCNQLEVPGDPQIPGICRPSNVGGHTGITKDALPFLRQTIVDDITDENVLVQDNPVRNLDKPHMHFDNSLFVEGVTYINEQYSAPRDFGAGGVIAELDPESPQIFDSLDEWGQLLHSAQDFYAHSNWVDYDPNDIQIFDSGIGLWTVPTPYGIVMRGDKRLMVVEGHPPSPDWGFYQSYLNGLERGVIVDPLRYISGDEHNGLISGAYPKKYNANNPVKVAILHGEGNESDASTTLNKDNIDRPYYNEAYAMAVKQTKNEWCRLLNLTKSKYGLKGASIPIALFVDPNFDPNKGSPHPSGTACSDPKPATQSVTVTLNKIQVINDKDILQIDPGDLNFSFVLYTNDFTRSVRNEVNLISVSSGKSVTAGKIFTPLTLDLNDPKQLVVTLQAWDDDADETVLVNGQLNAIDEILEGITLDLSKDFRYGTYQVESDDLKVCLTISGSNQRQRLLSEQSSDTNQKCRCDCEIPEPSFALSLIALGILGIGTGLQKKAGG